MSTIATFFAGLAITMAIVLAALSYLKNPLFLVLSTLCGATERAQFWTAFSNVTLFLVPAVIALSVRPAANDWPGAVFEISTQIEWGIVGFVSSVLVLGAVLSRNIATWNELHRVKGTNGR
jgi:predicted Na+-dependent transporter